MRLGINRRLMPLNPKGLRNHPFSGNRAFTGRVQAKCGIARGSDIGGFIRGPNIHPDQGRTKRLHFLVERRDAAGGSVDANSINLVRCN